MTGVSAYGRSVYPYERLKQPGSTIDSPDFDPHHREQHLSTAEFQRVLQVTKDEFDALPQWKQTSKKKAAGLF
eukprot:TRINITY_DN1259_c0_g1_i7.p2 TRINITY_DN1259_c0_g1~~TRINITY_DN1259_c0_g1_i7.p2  ORF type:complete len:73 (+),score=16.63 TRINITY_DN1259_c0_g1_i7:118-336(+)